MDKVLKTTIKSFTRGTESIVTIDKGFIDENDKILIDTNEKFDKKVYEVATTLPYRDFMTVGILLNELKIKNKTKIKTIKAITLDQINTSVGDIKTVGIIKNIKKITTKKKQQMAYVTVYDDTLELELTVFPDAYAKSVSAIKKNNIVVIEGYYRSFKDEFSVTQISSLEEK